MTVWHKANGSFGLYARLKTLVAFLFYHYNNYYRSLSIVAVCFRYILLATAFLALPLARGAETGLAQPQTFYGKLNGMDVLAQGDVLAFFASRKKQPDTSSGLPWGNVLHLTMHKNNTAAVVLNPEGLRVVHQPPDTGEDTGEDSQSFTRQPAPVSCLFPGCDAGSGQFSQNTTFIPAPTPDKCIQPTPTVPTLLTGVPDIDLTPALGWLNEKTLQLVSTTLAFFFRPQTSRSSSTLSALAGEALSTNYNRHYSDYTRLTYSSPDLPCTTSSEELKPTPFRYSFWEDEEEEDGKDGYISETSIVMKADRIELEIYPSPASSYSSDSASPSGQSLSAGDSNSVATATETQSAATPVATAQPTPAAQEGSSEMMVTGGSGAVVVRKVATTAQFRGGSTEKSETPDPQNKDVKQKASPPVKITDVTLCRGLIRAIEGNDRKKLTTLLKQDPRLANARDSNNISFLSRAISGGHTEMVAVLLGNGADPNAHWALAELGKNPNEHPEAIQKELANVLIARGSDPWRQPEDKDRLPAVARFCHKDWNSRPEVQTFVIGEAIIRKPDWREVKLGEVNFENYVACVIKNPAALQQALIYAEGKTAIVLQADSDEFRKIINEDNYEALVKFFSRYHYPGSLDTVDSEGKTPLSLAAQKGCYLILKLLYKKGFRCLPEPPWNIYSEPARRGFSVILEWLLDVGYPLDLSGEKDRDTLMCAISGGSLHCIELLLEIEHFPVSEKHREHAHKKMQNTNLSGSNAEKIYLILDGYIRGQAGLWEKLGSAGSLTLEFVQKEFNQYTCLPGGIKPLHLLIKRPGEATQILEYLLDHTACHTCLNQYDGEHTPLMLATQEGKTGLARVMIEHNAEINLKSTFFRRTALMIAVIHENLSLVKLLLDAGAKPGFQDLYGKTAEDLANEPIKFVLQQHMERNALLIMHDPFTDLLGQHLELSSRKPVQNPGTQLLPYEEPRERKISVENHGNPEFDSLLEERDRLRKRVAELDIRVHDLATQSRLDDEPSVDTDDTEYLMDVDKIRLVRLLTEAKEAQKKAQHYSIEARQEAMKRESELRKAREDLIIEQQYNELRHKKLMAELIEIQTKLESDSQLQTLQSKLIVHEQILRSQGTAEGVTRFQEMAIAEQRFPQLNNILQINLPHRARHYLETLDVPALMPEHSQWLNKIHWKLELQQSDWSYRAPPLALVSEAIRKRLKRRKHAPPLPENPFDVTEFRELLKTLEDSPVSTHSISVRSIIQSLVLPRYAIPLSPWKESEYLPFKIAERVRSLTDAPTAEEITEGARTDDPVEWLWEKKIKEPWLNALLLSTEGHSLPDSVSDRIIDLMPDDQRSGARDLEDSLKKHYEGMKKKYIQFDRDARSLVKHIEDSHRTDMREARQKGYELITKWGSIGNLVSRLVGPEYRETTEAVSSADTKPAWDLMAAHWLFHIRWILNKLEISMDNHADTVPVTTFEQSRIFTRIKQQIKRGLARSLLNLPPEVQEPQQIVDWLITPMTDEDGYYDQMRTAYFPATVKLLQVKSSSPSQTEFRGGGARDELTEVQLFKKTPPEIIDYLAGVFGSGSGITHNNFYLSFIMGLYQSVELSVTPYALLQRFHTNALMDYYALDSFSVATEIKRYYEQLYLEPVTEYQDARLADVYYQKLDRLLHQKIKNSVWQHILKRFSNRYSKNYWSLSKYQTGVEIVRHEYSQALKEPEKRLPILSDFVQPVHSGNKDYELPPWISIEGLVNDVRQDLASLNLTPQRHHKESTVDRRIRDEVQCLLRDITTTQKHFTRELEYLLFKWGRSVVTARLAVTQGLVKAWAVLAEDTSLGISALSEHLQNNPEESRVWDGITNGRLLADQDHNRKLIIKLIEALKKCVPLQNETINDPVENSLIKELDKLIAIWTKILKSLQKPLD